MADYFGAAKSLIGGVGDFLGSQAAAAGSQAAAKGYQASAASYATAARLSKAQTAIKQQMVDRDIYKTLGGMRASVGGSGLSVGGSAQDLIRDSARQGAITKAVVGMQGEIDYDSLMAQSASATGQADAETAKAKAEKTGGFLGAIGSVVKIAGAIFSDDRLKADVTFLRKRPDGIGLYRFRYEGSTQFYEGVMASDVQKIRPDAVHYEDDGMKWVDYAAIREQLRPV